MQRNRQRKRAACTVTGDNQKVIDVDTYKFAASPAKKGAWIVNGSFTLTYKERGILLSPREWLSDTIFNALQVLLKQGSGMHGFQETTLGMTLAYDVLQGGFVQILHHGFGHWLTIITTEATSPTVVFVYDSMYTTISTNVKR